MSEPYYPTLDEATVKNLDIIRQLSGEHKSYWLSAPYPGAIEKLVKSWFDPKTVRGLVNQARREEDEDKEESRQENPEEFLYQETIDLYRQVKTAKYAGDNEESMSYYKTAVSLQEKLLNLREKALGLKQVADHHACVMNILANILTEEQREKFIEELKLVMGK